MKRCPACQIDLSPQVYEDVHIHVCGQCGGTAVDISRLEQIKRRPTVPENELGAAAQQVYVGDSVEPVRCPACRAHMTRTQVAFNEQSIGIDTCKSCACIWLDPGELELIQLAFHATPQFQAAEELRARVAELEADPDRLKRFEDTVSALPSPPDPIEAGLKDVLHVLYECFINPRRHHPLRYIFQ